MFCICLFSAVSLFPAVIFGSVAMGGNIFLSLLNNCLAARGAHFSLYWWRISRDVWEIFPVLSSRGELSGPVPSFDITSYIFFFSLSPLECAEASYLHPEQQLLPDTLQIPILSRCPCINTSWGGCSESQAIIYWFFWYLRLRNTVCTTGLCCFGRAASPTCFPGLITFKPCILEIIWQSTHRLSIGANTSLTINSK